jgi:hypothetical protein
MTAKLRPEVKEIWLAALESGEYQQGQGSLERGGRFCCLGVRCRLAAERGIITRVMIPSADGGPDWVTYDGQEAMPPTAERRWAWGEDADLGDIEDAEFRLTHLNDNARKTFTEIAGIIRREY